MDKREGSDDDAKKSMYLSGITDNGLRITSMNMHVYYKALH